MKEQLKKLKDQLKKTENESLKESLRDKIKVLEKDKTVNK